MEINIVQTYDNRDAIRNVEDMGKHIAHTIDEMNRLDKAMQDSGNDGAKASEQYAAKLAVVSQGVDKMSAAMKAMGVASQSNADILQKANETNVRYVEGQLNRIKTLESTLRTALESGNEELAQATTAELNTAKQMTDDALTAIVNNTKRIYGEVKSASAEASGGDDVESVRMRLRQLTQEVMNYTVQLSRMSDEERSSAKGQELQKKLDDATKEAGELKDVMGDVNRAISGLASDTGNFDAFADAVNLVTSTVGAGTGAMAMLGMEEENLVEIQTTLQSSLAVSNALSVVQNTLQKESTLMLKINNIQQKAAAAAIKMKAAAEGKGVVATAAATVAQKAFNLVASMNPYVLLAMSLVTLVGVIWTLVHVLGKGSDEMEKTSDGVQKLKDKLEELAAPLEEDAIKFKNLAKEWENCQTVAQRTDYVYRYKDALKALGIEIKTAQDAERLFSTEGQKAFKQYTEARIKMQQTQAKIDKYAHDLRMNQMAAEIVQQRILSHQSEDLTKDMKLLNNYRAQIEANEKGLKAQTHNLGIYTQQANRASEAIKKLTNAEDKKKKTTTSKSGKSSADNAKREQEAYTKMLESNNEKRKELAKKIAQDTRDAEINALSEGYAKERKLREEEFRKEEQQIKENAEKLKQQYIDMRKAEFEANPNNKGKRFNPANVDNTEYNKNVDALAAAQYAALERAKTNYAREQEEERLRLRLDYLQQFGTLAQQQEAINAEYDRKRLEAIDNGASPYELQSIEAQRSQALSQNQLEQLKEDINWEEVFSNLDYVSAEHLERLRTQLRAALDMGDITAENARIITEKIDEIDKQIQQKRSVWGQLFGGATEGIGGVVNAIRDQKALNANAEAKRAEAEEAKLNYNRAKTDTAIAKSIFGEGSEKYLEAQRKEEEEKKKSDNANSASSKATAMASQAAMGATGAIIHGVNDNVQSFAEAAELIGGKDSEFAKTAAKFAESSQYATEGFEKFSKGDFIGAALSVGNAVNSLGETFGLWSNSNVAELQAENEKLANAMAINSEAVNRLTKAMTEGSAMEAYKNYEEAQAVMKQNERASAAILSNLDSMYDGHHSTEYYFNEKGGKDIVRRMGEAIGQNWGSINDVYWNAAQVNKLYETDEGRKLLNEFTQTLGDAESAAGMESNGIVGKLMEHLNNFSEEAYKELNRSFQQAVTGVSFDSWKSSFKSTLMDMQKDGKDFADDFTKNLTQSLLNSQIEETYGKELEQLYDSWVEALNDNNLSASEVTRLQDTQDKLVQRMIDTRDRIAAITGYDDVSTSEASGSINSAKSMSEDTANELIGRMTAVQIGVEGIRSQDNVMAQQVINGVTALMSITSVSASNNEVLNAILLQHVQSNSYLEDISKYNKAMYSEWGSQINAIRTKIDTL